MILYHADRAHRLSEGMTLELDKSHFPNSKVIQAWYPEGLSEHGKAYMSGIKYQMITTIDAAQSRLFIEDCVLQEADSSIASLACELEFELIRRTSFTDHPCRLQCLFAVDNLDDFEQWKSFGFSQDTPIYEIETSDSIQKYDSNWLRGGIGFYSNIKTYEARLYFYPHDVLLSASKYWSGESSESPRWEYLVPLPVTVGRRVQ